MADGGAPPDEPRLARDRLRLAQMLSPAFPIGGFAHSQGLEVAIARGQITDEPSLRAWIEASLRHSVVRLDGLFVALARRPGADLSALTALYDAYAPSVGRAREAEELGRGFQALTDPAAAPLPYPLAVGRATQALCLPEAEVLALWLQALVAQLVSVAVRFMPMGQVMGQRVIADLGVVIAGLASDIGRLGPEDLGGFAFGADMASMAQEHLEVRIFRS
jgi:urease accessory protein